MKSQLFINKSIPRWSALRNVVVGVSLAMLTFGGPIAVAGPHGFDLHNVLSPRAAGMAGTNIAGEGTGPVEAVFGNPANLTDFAGGTHFTYGATFYYPEARSEHDGIVTGNPYSSESNAEVFTVPQIAVTQDLHGVGIPIVLGLGLTAVSGIGVHYRRDAETLGAGAELIVFGINAAAGYQVSDALDLGAALTVSYATLEAGVAGSSGQGHDYGVRLTFGGDYHLGEATDIGFYYQTELEHTWQDFALLGNGASSDAMVAAGEAIADADYRSVTVDQPANYALGVSHQFTDELRVAADVIYKQWSQAKFWDRFYHDQTAISVGAEYDVGPWTLRAGYGYANDPSKQTSASALEGFDHICVGAPGIGTCFPLTGQGGEGVWSWLQAQETPVIYRHRLTAGFTYEGFLAPFLTLDTHVAHQFSEERSYRGNGTDRARHTELDVQSWHAGFGLTWAFGG